ncbi:MAG: UDP-N-acetylmuramoyl-tripeptide--D-alanyl-D-alanine ligase [Candidatus Omnitrophica bacterium]|nr:UDP-N-acetylmuramoyl-tripeptide--D-alanyl-D-alanine ligase [Candidatus Omnitrophota bacterium]
MLALTDFELALGTAAQGNRRELVAAGVSIDSRSLRAGEAFVAIRGAAHDGHRFAEQAREKGAAIFVIDRAAWPSLRAVLGENVLVVEDTTEALGRLAAYWRGKRAILRAAITGSSGKTTTKDLAKRLLARKYSVLATEGNLNNQYGLPLTLFKLDGSQDAVLAEIGASRPGDIEYLAGILDPGIGLITNVHPAHLEGFGSLEKVYETKLELGAHVARRGGTLLVNGDNPELRRRALGLGAEVLTFGRDAANDFTIENISAGGEWLRFRMAGRDFGLKSPALFNLENFASALVLAHAAGVPWEMLEGDLEDFAGQPGRFEIRRLPGEVTVVHDAYNANPGSMRQSLIAFDRLADLGSRKIAVLGDMKELGADSWSLHREIGRGWKDYAIPFLVTVGKDSRAIGEGAAESGGAEHICHFDVNREAGDFLRGFLRPGDAVFLKGSRSMKLEDILNGLTGPGGVHVLPVSVSPPG